MRIIAMLCVLITLQYSVFTCLPANADPMNVDLGSAERSVSASSLGITSALAIKVGGGVQTILPDSMLTPAEYMAAQQVLSAGRQTLNVGTGGQATGGHFAVPGNGANIHDLLVPNGVTVLQNFSSGGAVGISGNLVNAGNLYAFSTSSAHLDAVLSANSIHNQTQGVISSIVPSSVLLQSGIAGAVGNLNLTLNAAQEIKNEGSITSGGALSLNSPKVINRGTISSSASNVNFNSNDHLVVDNAGGKIAAAGNMNFRTPAFTEKKNLYVLGGELAAQNINLHSGDGHIKVNAQKIDGAVNIQGGSSAVTTHSGDLNVNSVNLTGDPAFYNTSGGITINSDLVFPGQDLAIIAARNVTLSGNRSINTSNAAGNGGDVTIVAGARFTTDGTNPVTPSGDTNGLPDTTSQLSISGPSAAGGSITLSGGSNLQMLDASGDAASNGGNVTLIAWKSVDSNVTSGDITMPTGITIQTTGLNGGNVTIYGGNTMQVSGITTTGGDVTIQTGNAVVTGGSGTVDLIDGTIQPGSASFAPPASQIPRGFSVQNISAGAGDVRLAGGASISTGNIVANDIDISVEGGSQSLNASTSDYTGNNVRIRVENGSANVRDISSPGGDIRIEASATNLRNLTTAGSGNVEMKWDGSAGTTNVGNITTADGRIEIYTTSTVNAGSLKTAGGNINIDVGGDWNSSFIIASNATNYGQVTIAADTIDIIGAEAGGMYGGEGVPTDNSLVGSSILIESRNAARYIKPIDNSDGFLWTGGSGLNISDSVAISRNVIISPSAGDLVINDIDTLGAGNDFVAVAQGNISPSTPGIGVDTVAGVGPGGQIFIRAGMPFDFPGGVFLRSGGTATGGSVNLSGTDFVTNSSTVVIGSASTASTNHSVTVGLINSTASGSIRLFNDFPSGATGTVTTENDLMANGGGPYNDGGRITIDAGTFRSTRGDSASLLTADGFLDGDGGVIKVNLYGASPSMDTISNSIGDFALSADGGAFARNGGTITITPIFAGLTLIVDPAAISLSPGASDGNGGNLTILNRGGGITTIMPGTLSVDGIGAGNGGAITVASAGGAYTLNVDADIDANGGVSGSGGSIFLSSGGGSTLLGSALTFSANGGSTADEANNGGTITLTNLGTFNQVTPLSLNANGGGYGDGGTVLIDASNSTALLSVGAGAIQISATGGSPSSGAGNGGSITVRNGGDLDVDAEAINLNPLGSSGDGGSLVVRTDTGGITLYSSGAAVFDLSAVGVGNGGSLFVDQLQTTAAPVQILTDIVANGGSVNGSGGFIEMFHLLSINGLLFGFNQPISDLSFAPGVNLIANAPTMGHGGSIRLYANSLTANGPTNLLALASSSMAPSQGGLDVNGGLVQLVTASDGANIDVSSTGFNLDVRGLTTSATARADGGFVQIFTRGLADIDVDVSNLAVNPFGLGTGDGGTVNLVSIHDGPHHNFTGGFQFDDYGGTVRMTGGTLNLTALGTVRDGGNFIAFTYGLDPLVIDAGIDISNNSSSEQGTMIISNLAPGGVAFQASSSISANNPSGDGGNINISASFLDISGPLSISADSAASRGADIVIATSDPAGVGSLSLGNTNFNDITLSATGAPTIKVMAGGDLTVDVASMGFDVNRPDSNLLFSAGVVPFHDVAFVVGGPLVFTDVNVVVQDFLPTQQGRLQVSGGLNVAGLGSGQGGSVTLVSNSSQLFSVNGGATSNGINGTIDVSAGPTGQFNGNAIIVNYGNGGITVGANSIINGDSSTAGGGGVVVDNTPVNNAIPAIPVGLAGLIEIYSPLGPVTLLGSLSTVGAAVGVADNSGGTIYVRGDTLFAAPNVTLSAYSNRLHGGAVYVSTTNAFNAPGSEIIVGPGGLSIDVSGGKNDGSGNAGRVSIVASGSLTVSPSDLLALAGAGTGNGATIELGARNGNLLVSGSLLANAGTLGGNAGSISLISGGTAPFIIGAVTSVNGVQGNIEARNFNNTVFGAISLLGDNSFAGGPFAISIESPLVSSSEITFESTRFAGLSVTVTSAGSLLGPVTARSTGSLIIDVQQAGNGIELDEAISFSGSTSVTVNGGTLLINPSAPVFAAGGSVLLRNTDTTSPTALIVIDNSALISSSSVGGTVPAAVNIVIGTVPTTPTGNPTVTGITPTTLNGGQLFFPSLGPGFDVQGTNTVAVAAGGNVVFSNQSTGGGSIVVNGMSGGPTRIQAVAFNSLDLTNGTNVQYIKDLQAAGVLSGTLNTSTPGGPATSGSVTIPQHISHAYTALNIPTGVTVNMSNVSEQSLITFALPASTSATVNGAWNFTGTGTGTIQLFFIGGAGSPYLLSMGSSGQISSTATQQSLFFNLSGSLNMDAGALIRTQSNATAGTITIGTFNGGATVGNLVADRVILQSFGSNVFDFTQADGGLIRTNSLSVLTSGATGTQAVPMNVQVGNPNARYLFISQNASFGCTACGATFNVDNNNKVAPLVMITASPFSTALTITSNGSVNYTGSPLGAGSVSITSTGGYLGTPFIPLVIDSPNIQLNATGTLGGINAQPVGPTTLSNSTSGDGLSFFSQAALTLSGAITTTGGNLSVTSNSLTVAPGASVIAEAGRVSLLAFNDITLGADSFVASIGTGAARVNISISMGPQDQNTIDPANITSIVNGGGIVYYGNDEITGNAPQNLIYASGSNAVVAFDTNGAGATNIILDGNVRVVAAGDLPSFKLTSLDLTDTGVQTEIQNLKDIGLVGGGAGNTELRPFNLAPQITLLNVPGSETLELISFAEGTPITITDPVPAQIDGTVTINSSAFVMNAADLVIDNGGLVTSSVDGSTITFNTQTISIGQTSLSRILTSGSTLNLNANTLNLGTSELTANLIRVGGANSLTVNGSSLADIQAGLFAMTAGNGALTVNSTLNVAADVLAEATTSINFAGNFAAAGSLEARPGSGTVNTTGTISARQFVVNVANGVTGTIQNPLGDVILSTNVKALGQNLAILAAGNIVAKSTFKSIDLSSANTAQNNGNGGNLTLIAGFDFTSSAASSTPQLGTFTLTGASTSGGSILLPGVTVNTSSKMTTRAPAAGSDERVRAGSVLAVAHSGSLNSGSVMLGNITATANKKDGDGGSVTVMAPGGIIVGNVATNGAGGGSVELLVREPEIVGTVSIVNGSLANGSFLPAPMTTETVSDIRAGNITTTGSVFAAGNFTAFATYGVTVGKINTQGAANVATNLPGNFAASGTVAIDGGLSSVSAGAITTSALSLVAANTANGGEAGDVSISGSDVSVNGSIAALGGATAGSGNGGKGADVVIITQAFGVERVGLAKISGGISVAGGNTKVGTPGAGGTVAVDAGYMSIGALSGFSVNAGGGTRGTTIGTPGSILLSTYSNQDVPSNFDLTSTTKSEFAIPGALFTVNAGAPVNGVSSPLRADVIVKKSDVNGLPGQGNGLIFASVGSFNSGNISINVFGNDSVPVTTTTGVDNIFVADIAGKRNKVTPTVALALYQLTNGAGQTITPVAGTGIANPGSTVAIDMASIPSKFTAFKMPAFTTVSFTGTNPIVRMPSSTVLNGSIAFPTIGNVALLDFGSGAVKNNGTISAASTLILSGTGGAWTNSGTISALARLAIARGTSATLTVTNSGSSADITAPSLLLGPSLDQSISINFKAIQSGFGTQIEFGQMPVPTVFGTVATATAKQYTLKPAVNLTFALLSNGLVPIAPVIGGTIDASSVKITSLPVKVTGNPTTFLTPLTISGATINANSAITILPCGELDIVFSSLSAGVGDGSLLSSAGVVLPTQITTKGKIEITTSTASSPDDMFLQGSLLRTIGGDIKITSKQVGSDIDIFASSFRAIGGNVIVLAREEVGGTASVQVIAQAVGTTTANSKGGGIEFASGTTTSKLSSILGLPPGTTPSISIGDVGITNTVGSTAHGVVQAMTSGGSTIDLNTGGVFPSAINVSNGGAVLFQAQNGRNLNFENISFFTAALKPIAHVTAGGVAVNAMNNDMLINSKENIAIRTAFGDIKVRKGAVASVSQDARGLRITALSGPADVAVEIGKQTLTLAPGEEVFLSGGGAAGSGARKADGIGRRGFARHVFPNGVVAHRCEVSILSMIANAGHMQKLSRPETKAEKAIASRLMKTAAALHLMTVGRGSFSAIAKPKNAEKPLLPVSYNQAGM